MINGELSLVFLAAVVVLFPLARQAGHSGALHGDDAGCVGVGFGRIGAPEEVAAAVVDLASDEAAWVTGVTLHVNGGMAMI